MNFQARGSKLAIGNNRSTYREPAEQLVAALGPALASAGQDSLHSPKFEAMAPFENQGILVGSLARHLAQTLQFQ